MENKIQLELNDFKKFKKDFEFKQKEIIIDGKNLYCDGELLQKGEDKPAIETEKWINVGYNLKSEFSKALSNLFPYEFTFDGEHLCSIEAFFQGIKIKDENTQKYAFKYSGIDANSLKAASDFN